MQVFDVIDRPVSKLTASILLIGGLGSMVGASYLGFNIAVETYAILGATLGSAATFLFMADKDKDNQ